MPEVILVNFWHMLFYEVVAFFPHSRYSLHECVSEVVVPSSLHGAVSESAVQPVKDIGWMMMVVARARAVTDELRILGQLLEFGIVWFECGIHQFIHKYRQEQSDREVLNVLRIDNVDVPLVL